MSGVCLDIFGGVRGAGVKVEWGKLLQAKKGKCGGTGLGEEEQQRGVASTAVPCLFMSRERAAGGPCLTQ